MGSTLPRRRRLTSCMSIISSRSSLVCTMGEVESSMNEDGNGRKLTEVESVIPDLSTGNSVLKSIQILWHERIEWPNSGQGQGCPQHLSAQEACREATRPNSTRWYRVLSAGQMLSQFTSEQYQGLWRLTDECTPWQPHILQPQIASGEPSPGMWAWEICKWGGIPWCHLDRCTVAFHTWGDSCGWTQSRICQQYDWMKRTLHHCSITVTRENDRVWLK